MIVKDEKTLAFITRSNLIQLEGYYSYPETLVKNAREKVKIHCNRCGEDFFQAPDNHARLGMGCRKCSHASSKGTQSNKKKTTNEFIEESTSKYGIDLYGFNKTVYLGKAIPLTLTCLVHGTDFQVTPNNHLSSGSGCKECGIEKSHVKFRKSEEDFIRDSKKVHGPYTFLYDLVMYINNKSEVILKCTKGGHTFSTRPDGHLSKGYGCPLCKTSNQELEFSNFISLIDPSARLNTRKVIPPLEIDVLIESRKTAFEYDGLYWHSEAEGKTRQYHLNKTDRCAEAGYRLVHVFEDEWRERESIVKSRVQYLLNQDSALTDLTGLEVSPVLSKEAVEFFHVHHLKGTLDKYDFSYGLFNGGVLVACMSFNKVSKVEAELVRYASIGSKTKGFDALLAEFIKRNKKYPLITCTTDKRWSVGTSLLATRFEKVDTLIPSYDYVTSDYQRLNGDLFTREYMSKNLKKYDASLTEVENCKNNRLYRIWNCGMDKWELDLTK